MELLREFSETDVGISRVEKKEVCYKLRRAVRALVFNEANQLAILFVSNNGYNKLPGGGVEENEELYEALKREVFEETGCDINLRSSSVGATIEYRDDFQQLQISYCYLADVVGIPNTASFTEREIADGFQLRWMSVEEAIDTLNNDHPNNYLGKFIRQRDLEFLQKAKELLPNQ
ncbi:NUDIX domain-containing protein [Candidatus Parcubacteria bacterium]|nr:MAG: NUDIX domain-containing protein [Candidatus Parcubacteria bacterium]